jgi:hypothetical protein
MVCIAVAALVLLGGEAHLVDTLGGFFLGSFRCEHGRTDAIGRAVKGLLHFGKEGQADGLRECYTVMG